MDSNSNDCFTSIFFDNDICPSSSPHVSVPPKKLPECDKCDHFKSLEIKCDALEEKLQCSVDANDRKEVRHERMIDSVRKKSDRMLANVTSANAKLSEEVEMLKDKNVYKSNSALKNKNKDLEATVDSLGKENEKLKSSTSHATVNGLKRKIVNEQAEKCKWKSKFRKLDASLVDHEYESSDSDSDDEPLVNLREPENNKFKTNVRLTFMALQGEADVTVTKCSKVAKIVSNLLHGKKVEGLPCTSSVLNFADEGHYVAKFNIGEKLLDSEHFTFGSDATSRAKVHYMERHVTLDDGTILSLGFTEIASDDAKSMLEQAIDILEEIVHIYCDSDVECTGY